MSYADAVGQKYFACVHLMFSLCVTVKNTDTIASNGADITPALHWQTFYVEYLKNASLTWKLRKIFYSQCTFGNFILCFVTNSKVVTNISIQISWNDTKVIAQIRLTIRELIYLF